MWEIKFYEHDLIEYERIEPLETSEKIEMITGSKFIKDVTRQIKTYDLETHLKRGSEKTRSVFDAMREKILDLGDVTEKYLKDYIGYRISERKLNFVTIHIYKEKLKIYILIPKTKLSDPKKLATTIPKSYGWAKNLALFTVRYEKDVPYAMELIAQSYEFNKNR